MSATLRALLCVASVSAGLQWQRIEAPPPTDFSLVTSGSEAATVVRSSDGDIRFRLPDDTSWTWIPSDPWLGSCWDSKCLSFRDGDNPTLLDLGTRRGIKTYGGIAKATSGTLLKGKGFSRHGNLVLKGFLTAKSGQELFLGMDTIDAQGIHTFAWRSIRSPSADSTEEYLALLTGRRIYFQSVREYLEQTTLAKTWWSEDSGRSWKESEFDTRALVGKNDTVVAVTGGFRLAISLDGGRTWDSTAQAPRDQAGYLVLAGRLWMHNAPASRVSWSSDLGKTWIECPGLRSLPNYDGSLLHAEGETGLLVADPVHLRWTTAQGQYAVDRLKAIHPFTDGFFATTTQTWQGINFRMIRRSAGAWTKLDNDIRQFASGQADVVVLRGLSHGGVVAEHSTDGKTWKTLDTLKDYWREAVASDGRGNVALFDGDDLRRSFDGGRTWIRHIPGIRSSSTANSCFPAGFDPNDRLLCSLYDSVFRYDNDRWNRLAAPTEQQGLGTLRENGPCFTRDGLWDCGGSPYRDSLLASIDNHVWILWEGGSRMVGSGMEPAGLRIAAWVPSGRGSETDSVLIAQDSLGNLWEGRPSPIPLSGIRSARSGRIRIEGGNLVVDLDRDSPGLALRWLSPGGRTLDARRTPPLARGTQTIPLRNQKGASFVEVVGPGVRLVLPRTGI